MLYSLLLLSKDEKCSLFFPLFSFLLAFHSTFCCRKQKYVLIVKQDMYLHGINHSFSGFLYSSVFERPGELFDLCTSTSFIVVFFPILFSKTAEELELREV